MNVNILKNLALIETSLNEELGNIFYIDKREKFNKLKEHSEFLNSISDVFKYNKFWENELEDRFTLMKRFAREFFDNLIFPKTKS